MPEINTRCDLFDVEIINCDDKANSCYEIKVYNLQEVDLIGTEKNCNCTI